MSEEKVESWQKNFNRLWDELVPSSGQAATVQGELVRCIGRLTDEAYRNGNGNFDDGYRLMCRFLREKLADSAVFSREEIAHMNSCIDRILDEEYPDIDGPYTCYDRLAEQVVRWCSARKEPIPHRIDSRQYR